MRLALDLGTNTGYALANDAGESIIVGTQNLKPSRHESEGVRYLKFQQSLSMIHETVPINRVYYEAVERHAGTIAAHVYGGLRGVLVAWCESNKILYEGVPVGTIKKFWTGKGNAKKDAMIAEAVRRGIKVRNDNEADAVALLHWSLQERPAL
jgi:Holliday junction resolvasome RuvABC endonuclease subunit